jgi:CTP-dependent riboflavin kinase
VKRALKIRGRLVSGAKKAAFFTQLEWVKEQCQDKFGFTPYPGTVNLEVLKEDLPKLMLIKKEEGIKLVPPDPKFCEGRTLKASIRGVNGCIFMPPQDVNIHQQNIIEFMAPVMVKSTLGVEDGDILTVEVEVN